MYTMTTGTSIDRCIKSPPSNSESADFRISATNADELSCGGECNSCHNDSTGDLSMAMQTSSISSHSHTIYPKDQMSVSTSVTSSTNVARAVNETKLQSTLMYAAGHGTSNNHTMSNTQGLGSVSFYECSSDLADAEGIWEQELSIDAGQLRYDKQYSNTYVSGIPSHHGHGQSSYSQEERNLQQLHVFSGAGLVAVDLPYASRASTGVDTSTPSSPITREPQITFEQGNHRNQPIRYVVSDRETVARLRRLQRRAERDNRSLERRNLTRRRYSKPTAEETFQEEVKILLADIVRRLRFREDSSDGDSIRLQAAQQLRKLLSREKNPPIEQVVAIGIISDLITFMKMDIHPSLQFEAAWCLTNLASGTDPHTQLVIEAGGVEAFAHLLSVHDLQTVEQAVWGIGNVAGNSAECRDLVLRSGCLKPILQILQTTRRVSLLRNATWTLSNICRGKPAVDMSLVEQALPIFKQLVYREDREVLIDICWGLSYLTDGANDKIQAVVDLGITKRLVDLLRHESIHVVTPALRTIGNIATGEDHQTQKVISSGALPALKSLLSSTKPAIRKETCWTLSNITAGTAAQIQLVYDEDILPILVNMADYELFDTQKEAVWALANLTSGADKKHIEYIVGLGVFNPLIALLGTEDRLIHVILECLDNILKAGQTVGHRTNPYAKTLIDMKIRETLVSMAEDPDTDEMVYGKVVLLLHDHFAGSL
eukprot:CFRG3859T1